MGTVASSVSSNMFQFLLVVSLVSLSYGGTPVCNTIWEEKCWDEPRQQCIAVQKPYTSTYYEDECKTVKVPQVEHSDVCNIIYQDECKTVYNDECTYKDEQKCEEFTESKTDIVTKNKCELVQEEKCYQVPKNTCDTVE